MMSHESGGDSCCATRRSYCTEEKLRIVVEGLRAEDRIAELCRREGLNACVSRWIYTHSLNTGSRYLVADARGRTPSTFGMGQATEISS